MNRAFFYLIRRSVVNSLRFRLSRLKSPRYLVPTILGLLYFSWIFTGFGTSNGKDVSWDPKITSAWAGVGIVLGLIAILLLMWIFASRRPTLAFTEAEVHLLFPAPVTRKELIRYRLLKNQPGLVFAGIIAALFSLRARGDLSPLFVGIGTYMAVNLLTLHNAGASLTTANLLEHGVGGLRRLALPLLVLAGLLGMIALSIRRPETPILSPTDLMVWLNTAFTTGAAGVILWPLRQVTLLPFSLDAATFGLRLLPVLGLLFLHYLWIMRCDAAFEEAALALSQKIARTLEAARRGRLSVERTAPSPKRTRPALVSLAPSGPAWRAVSWKNFLALTRELSPKFLLVIFLLFLLAFGVLSAVVPDLGDDEEALDLSAVFGGILAGCAALFGLFTSSLMREDMRRDLENVDLLKTFPLDGRALLRGEVLGGTLYAGGIQIALVLAAAGFFMASTTRPFSIFEIVMVGLGAVILLPFFGYLS
ncbi:MAG: putative ABC exporter domain-containing protein [Planctomycetota bacterium]|jgi:hypothetical protein